MWFAPPTFRQLLWMFWEETKRSIWPPKTCDLCGVYNPAEKFRKLRLCTSCCKVVTENLKK